MDRNARIAYRILTLTCAAGRGREKFRMVPQRRRRLKPIFTKRLQDAVRRV